MRRAAVAGSLAVAIATVVATEWTSAGVRFPQSGELWVLSIGIDRYQHKDIFPLASAVADARAIAGILDKQALIRPAHVDTLFGESATRVNILAKLKGLSARVTRGQQELGSIFVLFLGGQGFHEQGEYIYTPVDFDPRQPVSTGITARELKIWTDRIAAPNQLLILDSGFSSLAQQALARNLSADEVALKDARDRNIVVFGYDGPGRETPEHGVLTAAVLDGLGGKAGLLKDPGNITARELEGYTAGRVVELSSGEVRLQSYAQGQNFPLVKSRGRGAAPANADQSRGVTSIAPPEPPAGTEAPPRHDYALLIGVDEYEHFPKLANPVDDAGTIGRELHEVYGFETKVLANSTQAEVLDALRELARKTYGPEDQLFVFIAGHGEYVELGEGGEGYLIARDSKPQTDGGVNPLSHANLRQILQNVRVPHLLLALDSCFSGTFDPALSSGGARSNPYEAAGRADLMLRNLKLKAKWWVTSGGKEYVSDGIPKNHSPFARKFLETLRTYGGPSGILTSAKLLADMGELRVAPRYGSFPDSDAGAQFLFVTRPTAEKQVSGALRRAEVQRH